ncbi:MAG: heme exporter protein CcmD [Phenylobacterium sp.]|nr:heme exporter protein CcmD [Phenylobacterium sp.]
MFDGKYAEFIVPAFVITAIVFAGMVAFSLNHARRWRRRFEALDRAGRDQP